MLQPGRFTELFFLDEVTAFAAGHRPCALCRRTDYDRFREIWGEIHRGEVTADLIDARLHGERLAADARAQLHHEAPFGELPDGVFVLADAEPFLVLGTQLRRWTPAGYEAGIPRPVGRQAVVITPRSLVQVLRRGWQSAVPMMHPSSRAASAPGPVT